MRISHSGEQPISLRGSIKGSITGESKNEIWDFMGFLLLHQGEGIPIKYIISFWDTSLL